MRLEIYGSLLDSSGYSQHCRFLTNALFQYHDDINLNVLLPQGWESLVNEKEIQMLNKPPVKDFDALFIGQPPAWRFVLSNKPRKFFGYVIFEGDKIPKYWVDHLINPMVDGIIVPSQHVKDAIIKTAKDFDRSVLEIPGGMPKAGEKKIGKFITYDELMERDVHVIPHGVDLNIFKEEPIAHDKFTFLSNKGWRGGENDRGGVQFLFRAFVEEFTEKDNVRLLCHLNPAYPCDIQTELNKLNLRQTDVPEVLINNKPMTYKELNDFYNNGDVYVSPTRAEAFNIPIAEASACGIPSIVTGYGGQCDIVKDGINGLYIDYKLEPVTFDINYEGVEWATPNIEDLRKKLRWAYENQDRVKEMGHKAKEMIQDFTWDNSAKLLLELIEK